MRRWVKRALTVLAASGALMAVAAFPAYAGQWKQDGNGWWWQNDQGGFPADKWEWIDGNNDGIYENYYFNQAGYLLTNTITPDSHSVNANGAQLVDGKVNILNMGLDDWEWETVATNIKVDGSLERESQTDQVNDVRDVEISPYELAYLVADLVNEKRLKAGKHELVIDDELMRNAMLRAEEIGGLFSHTRPDGSSCASAITISHSLIGENIAWEKFDTLENVAHSVTEGWFNSSGHKTIMLTARFELTGIGVYVADDGVYIVQEFVK